MSYSLGFWSASVETLVAAVAPARVGASPGSVAGDAVRALDAIGKRVGSVTHSSGGGNWFRGDFMDGVAAPLIGAEPVSFLLDRELAGMRWDGYPSMGWLTRAELAEVITRLDEAGEEAVARVADPESAETLEDFIGILRAVAAAGRDAVTCYA